MKNNPMNIHSQEYMETMARLMSEALESPEGMQALAAAIAAPIEQEIRRKEISSLLLTKHTLPLINSKYCPQTYYLHELTSYPDDLENYVLKPLYSFAGTGVQVDVTKAMLNEIDDRENYILQRKIEYAPLIKTPDEHARVEIRLMFIWDDKPILVNNLLRTSKGKMMGVDFNKNKTWVGSSLAYHRPEI